MTGAATLTPLGHAGTLQVLRDLWAEGSGPRTLLFAGPESVGRRKAARWLAAYVNCQRPGQAPCLACESCRLLMAGSHPDVKEVGPATTTGTGRVKRSLEIRIDQLVPRERGDVEPLGPWLLTRPHFNVRVGIIDHAEAMNAAAANSLLKLLEEPPTWALLLLIAPGPEAVLPTVASRSVAVRFRPLAEQDLTGIPGLEQDHPAVRLGQPGVLLTGSEEGSLEAQNRAREAAYALLGAVSGSLTEALAAGEELAAALGTGAAGDGGPGPLVWLRHAVRSQEPTRYAAALEAIDACEEALAHYAQAPLACAVLTLELRRLLT